MALVTECMVAYLIRLCEDLNELLPDDPRRRSYTGRGVVVLPVVTKRALFDLLCTKYKEQEAVIRSGRIGAAPLLPAPPALTTFKRALGEVGTAEDPKRRGARAGPRAGLAGAARPWGSCVR